MIEDRSEDAADHNSEHDVQVAWASLTPEQLRETRESMRDTIEVLSSRVQWLEGRRESIGIQLSTTLAIAGIAVVTLGARLVVDAARLGAEAFGVALALTGVVLLIVFYGQSAGTPKLRGTPTPGKWWYGWALPGYKEFDVPWLGFLRKDRRVIAEKHLSDELGVFVGGAAGVIGDPILDAQEDLQQLFMLHVIERYRQEFLERLRRVFMYGLLASCAFAAGVAGIWSV